MNEEYNPMIDEDPLSHTARYERPFDMSPTPAGSIPHDHQYEDFKAASAISGMPPGGLHDKLEFLEREYNDWTASESSWERFKFLSAFFKKDRPRLSILSMAREPFRIFRIQLRELALAYADLQNQKKASDIQASIGQAYIKAQQQHAEFRKFLMEHFETETSRGTARNQTLYEIAIDIMLLGKK